VIDHALAAGLLSPGQIQRARRIQLERSGQGDHSGLLAVLGAEFLRAEDLPALKAVYAQALAAPAPPAELEDSTPTLQGGPTPSEGPPTAALASAGPGVAPPDAATRAPLPASGLHQSLAASAEAGPVRIGAYEVLRELARGGMGAVYVARHTDLEREVAIKVLLQADAPATHVERFLREARATARLRHPNVVPVHELGEEGGRSFIVMDLVPGESLAARVRREGPLDLDEAARLGEGMARGVAHAHTQGVLHRDLKPANVLLSPQGEPLVTDFGLARLADEDRLTRTGVLLGTPNYMPPEQADGSSTDERSDVYSLGATIYELVTGEPPFTADTVIKVVHAVIKNPPPPPSSLRADASPDLETILLKALEKDPADRYATAADLADDLARLRAGEPIAARPPSRTTLARRWLRRRRAVVAGPVALAVAAPLTWAAWVQVGRPLLDLVREAPAPAPPAPTEEPGLTAAERADAEARLDAYLAGTDRRDRVAHLRGWLEEHGARMPAAAERATAALRRDAPLARRDLDPPGERWAVTLLEGGWVAAAWVGPGHRRLHLWRPEDGAARPLELPGHAVAAGPTGDRRALLVATAAPGRTHLVEWPAGAEELEDPVDLGPAEPDPITAGAVSAAAGAVALARPGGRIDVFGLDGEPLASLPAPRRAPDGGDGAAWAWRLLAFSGDGSRLLALGAAGGGEAPMDLMTKSSPVAYWDWRARRRVTVAADPPGHPACVAAAPAGRLFAIGTTSQFVYLFGGERPLPLTFPRPDDERDPTHRDVPRGLAFAPGGRRLYSVAGTAVADGRERAWSVWDRAPEGDPSDPTAWTRASHVEALEGAPFGLDLHGGRLAFAGVRGEPPASAWVEVWQAPPDP